MTEKRRSPASTYRIQLHREFTFGDLASIVPYLDSLGVTDLYLSPILAARPGSTHGYDICDHGTLNPELGDASDYRNLLAAVTARSMGLVLDFVPNHMGIDPATNRWWRDVLANGSRSRHARTFDVDWDPLKAETRGKVLLPILGAPYGQVLERGELRLERGKEGVHLRYFDHDLPLDAAGLAIVLDAGSFASDDRAAAAFAGIAAKLREGDRSEEILRRLHDLLEESAPVREHVDRRLAELNGRAGEPASFDALHEILERQSYRLAYWKTAFHEINYRRFFDINDLAGIRVEDPEVFEETHAFLFELVAAGGITGIRLDHIDGLFDPAAYLERLRSRVGDLWIVVEKILCEGESLPSSWPVAGTTGYEFLNDLNGLFVDPRHARSMQRFYRRFTSRTAPFPIVTYVGKRLIMQTSMASELSVLADGLNRISEGDRRSRDFTLESLREALREVVACFPVYRTYVSAGGASEADRRTLESALALARRRNPAIEPSIFDFLRSVLLVEADAAGRLALAMRFQQYSGPVQAKGVEDTAFYRYNVLLSLNEVGGEPDRFGRTPAAFHDANRRRRDEWPRSMLTTATHDTKRGEDARARLNVLSELAREWQAAVSRWARLNAAKRTRVESEWAPDRNEEVLYYQSLLAVWPPAAGAGAAASLVPRLQAYLVKALREAKLHTSWTNPIEAWERAVISFVERTLVGPGAGKFLEAFLPFQAEVARLGASVSLAQLGLKLASPGVPDVYQGTELWDLSLVDPDNRRPVDYESRRAELAALEPWLAEGAVPGREEAVAGLLAGWPDGRIKLYLTACALRLRRSRPELFLDGEYLPLFPEAGGDEPVVAFARRRGETALVVVAARFPASRTEPGRPFATGTAAWGASRIALPAELARGPFVDRFTGRRIVPDGTRHLLLADAFAVLPVAWLLAAPPAPARS